MANWSQDVWDEGGAYDEHGRWVDAQDLLAPGRVRDPYAEALQALERNGGDLAATLVSDDPGLD